MLDQNGRRSSGAISDEASEVGTSAEPIAARPRTVIRALEDKDLDGVYELYTQVFGEEPLRRFRQRRSWQFEENPATRLTPSRCFVAERRGGIVGFIASFPARFKLGDEERVLHLECDLLVSEKVRRHDPTAAIRLLRTSTENPDHVLSNAFGYSPSHRQLRDWLKHRPVHATPIHVRPYHCGAILEFLVSSGRLPGILGAPPLSWLLRGLGVALDAVKALVNRMRRPSASDDYSIEIVTEIDEQFDALWNRLSASFPIVAVRDRQFVQWRFVDDPVFDNTVLVARDRDGMIAGYTAVRMTMKGPMRVGRIMDIFCSPTSTVLTTSLLRAALDHLERQRVDVVSCMGMHPAIRDVVKRYLYVAPRSLNNPALLLWKGSEDLRETVYDQASWHLSHADGDEGFAP